ncbi:hypothetical protein YC2023_077374 [Brassica napus]|uniref:(rape) hypothetical protein n=1 Tax=Brassica napus TaxID=3708 RepID=A0A816Q7M2_BRANA|nr:unnamed protein product [Brassica napus]
MSKNLEYSSVFFIRNSAKLFLLERKKKWPEMQLASLGRQSGCNLISIEPYTTLEPFWNGKDIPPGELYSQPANYIAAAHSLKPSYSVYSSALRLVRSMLPLPLLKIGYLTTPPMENSLAQLLQGLSQFENLSGKSEPMSTNVERKTVRVNITEIGSVTTCADLTLPHGAGLCIDTVHGPVYLVADSWESLDGWMDAIRLVSKGKSDVLAGIITA